MGRSREMETQHAVLLSAYAMAVILGIIYLHKDELLHLLDLVLERPIAESLHLTAV